MDVKVKRCSACGRDVVLVSVEGQGRECCDSKQIPYVRDPNSRTIIITSHGQRVRGRQVRDARDADGFGWLLHYGSCRKQQELNAITQQETLFPPLRPR